MRSQSFQGMGRLPGLPVFLMMAMVSVVSLAACGGDGGSSSTATATQTGSTPEVTQPGGNDGPTEPLSQSERLFLTAGQFEAKRLALRSGDSLTISYEAQSVIVGAGDVSNLAPAGVVMTVLDPLEMKVYGGEQKKTDEVTLTLELDGEYQIIFQNMFPLQAQDVKVTYSVNQ